MIRLESLGGLRVLKHGVELPALPGKPLRAAMLVYLAVEGEASREHLCGLLWPESGPRNARRSLSQTLLELKKELGEEWVRAAGQELRTTSRLETDVRTLAEAARDGDAHGVVGTYGGPFLEGIHLGRGVKFERWIEDKRSEVHRTVRGALRELAARAGDPSERVRVTRRWVELDPLDDEAQHALIDALAHSGQRRDALAQYDLYADLIARELEVEPLDQTKELVRRIKDGEIGPSGLVAGEPAHAPAPESGRSEGGHATDERWDELAEASDRREGRGPDLGDGDLHVTRLLADGSTGPVLLARERALGRSVVVKVLDPELAEYPLARARFELEARLAARVEHDNVAQVHRVGVTRDGRPYFVMRYVRGITLAEHLRAHGALPAAEVRRFVAETAAALAAAHAAGVIHRDVRPANVMFDEETGHIYLVDFGIAAVLESADEETARLTRSGELLGNPAYISPEQARGDALTDRADVYSLGILGWELLLGRSVPRDVAVRSGHVDDAELVDVLRRATARDPRHRPSARHIARVLSVPSDDAGGGRSLLSKILRRRLPQFVGAYLAGGVAAMSGVDQLVQQDLLQPVAYRLALAFFIAGLNAVIIVTWFHGKKGRQRVSALEVALLLVVLVGWIVATVATLGAA